MYAESAVESVHPAKGGSARSVPREQFRHRQEFYTLYRPVLEQEVRSQDPNGQTPWDACEMRPISKRRTPLTRIYARYGVAFRICFQLNSYG